MFKVGDKVHIHNPKTQGYAWKDNDGVIIQILDANNSFINKDVKVHIVQLADGQQSPVEEVYLSLI